MQLRQANNQELGKIQELWIDIPGYSGQYAAFHKGAILNRVTGKVLKPTVFSCGYPYVTICVNGQKKHKRVHRLICETFISNPHNKSEVNHIDGNKLNFHISNLEWVTSSENKKHAFRIGLMKPTSPQKGKFNELNARSKQVAQLTLNGTLVKIWPSIAEACRHGFSIANICKVCKGERHSHKGFIWKYNNH